MGDRLRARKPSRFVTSHLGPTQPSTVSGTQNEYRPKCAVTLCGWKAKAGMIAD